MGAQARPILVSAEPPVAPSDNVTWLRRSSSNLSSARRSILRSSRHGWPNVLNLLTVSVHRMRATSAAMIWSASSFKARRRGGGKCWSCDEWCALIEPSLQLASLAPVIAQHKAVRTNMQISMARDSPWGGCRLVRRPHRSERNDDFVRRFEWRCCLTGISVLVVVDHATIRICIEDLLWEAGCIGLGPAISINDALAVMQTHRPEAVRAQLHAHRWDGSSGRGRIEGTRRAVRAAYRS